MDLFRGFNAAASLKPLQGAQVTVLNALLFRGFNAAASLKLLLTRGAAGTDGVALPRF